MTIHVLAGKEQNHCQIARVLGVTVTFPPESGPVILAPYSARGNIKPGPELAGSSLG